MKYDKIVQEIWFNSFRNIGLEEVNLDGPSHLLSWSQDLVWCSIGTSLGFFGRAFARTLYSSKTGLKVLPLLFLFFSPSHLSELSFLTSFFAASSSFSFPPSFLNNFTLLNFLLRFCFLSWSTRAELISTISMPTSNCSTVTCSRARGHKIRYKSCISYPTVERERLLCKQQGNFLSLYFFLESSLVNPTVQYRHHYI